MTYRDELIRRLQQDGSWEGMTADNQRRFRQLSDDQARQMMVLQDQWAFGESDAVDTLGLSSLVQMIQSFRGALIETEGENTGRLAKPGRMLAEFLTELSSRGLSTDEIDTGLNKLSPMVISALLASHQLTQ